MKIDDTTIVLAVFPIPAVFSGFLVLTAENKVKTSEDPGMQLDEVDSYGELLEEFSGISGNNIFQKAEIQDIPLRLRNTGRGLKLL